MELSASPLETVWPSSGAMLGVPRISVMSPSWVHTDHMRSYDPSHAGMTIYVLTAILTWETRTIYNLTIILTWENSSVTPWEISSVTPWQNSSVTPWENSSVTLQHTPAGLHSR